ncbi:MAG: carbohydrate ABC transporter permease [Bifidobacteriaceae bacterium]|jgi:ABC-type glycerol-3-phosphate transport system permease component|nr:carbohydrate ABC transporter permease [Bifidobacteriaceae bacterium]
MTRRRKTWGWVIAILLFAFMLFINVPMILTAINSFRPTNSILLQSVDLLPSDATFDNYATASSKGGYWDFFRNSIVIALVTTAITLVATGFAGYSLSRYRTKINAGFSSALMAFQLFPIILAVVPLFVLFSKFNMMSTPMPVTILYIVMSLPFCTWMFKGFFDSIPRELEEAARIDGCSSFRAMISVVLPLAGPGAAAVAIFAFLQAYNEYMVASAFLQNPSSYTISVGLRAFMQQYQTDWGPIFATSVLAALPPLILFLLLQKWMIKGMAAGAVKG